MTTNEPRKCWDVFYNIQDGATGYGETERVEADDGEEAREIVRECLKATFDCFDAPYDYPWKFTMTGGYQEVSIGVAVRVPDMAWIVKRLVDAVNVVTATKMELAKAPLEVLRASLGCAEKMLDSIVEEARR